MVYMSSRKAWDDSMVWYSSQGPFKCCALSCVQLNSCHAGRSEYAQVATTPGVMCVEMPTCQGLAALAATFMMKLGS